MPLYGLLKQGALQAKVKPPEENGLTLSHWTFTVFTCLKYSWKLEKKCVKSYKLVQHCNGVTEFKQVEN